MAPYQTNAMVRLIVCNAMDMVRVRMKVFASVLRVILVTNVRFTVLLPMAKYAEDMVPVNRTKYRF